MRVMNLWKGAPVPITAEEEQKISIAMTRGIKDFTVKGRLYLAANVAGFEDVDRIVLKDGRWICGHGHTHAKEDTYCGIGELKQTGLVARTQRSEGEEQEEYELGRKQMEQIRQDLQEKLRWPKK